MNTGPPFNHCSSSRSLLGSRLHPTSVPHYPVQKSFLQGGEGSRIARAQWQCTSLIWLFCCARCSTIM